MISQLEAFVQELSDRAEPQSKNFVLVTCDAIGSFRLGSFVERFPDRVIDVGISEASAIATSYGLALSGLKVFVAGFASFLVGKGLEGIRSYLAYHRADVTLLGGMAGLSACFDGAMHQATEDIGLLRAIPGVEIVTASDQITTRSLAEHCLREAGPRYVRLVRRPVELEQASRGGSTRWTPLTWRTPAEGTVVICAAGAMMAEASQAVALLSRNYGISAALLEIGRIAPFPRLAFRSMIMPFTDVVVCEDHQSEGGLGQLVESALHGSIARVLRLDLEWKHLGSGAYDALLEAAGLSGAAIARQAAEWLGTDCVKPNEPGTPSLLHRL
jgi:transketolase